MTKNKDDDTELHNFDINNRKEGEPRMDISEVKQLLSSGEKVDIECKTSENSVPKALWDTYSSFANTKGGYIFLGIEENKKNPVERFRIQGLKNATKQVEDFWNTINGNKVNVNILRDDDVRIVSDPATDAEIVSIHVPRADYNFRPVYVGENPYKGTFKRNHEGDYHASKDEVNAMIRDQNTDGNDAMVLARYDMDDIDRETLQHYRTVFRVKNPDHVWNLHDDKTFLTDLGGYRKDRDNGAEGLTLAGLLMFGKGLPIREKFSNIMMDYRDESQVTDETRWVDRVTYDGTWENNLFNFFMKVSPKVTADLKKPFVLENMQRVDDTPIHKAVREAFVNMMIHADYLMDAGTLKIIKKKDEFEFTNPGSLKLSVEEIFKGGNSKSRNPHMQTMLRMIGFGDNAGSGIPTILSTWNQAEWIKPELFEDTSLNQVTLRLKTMAEWTEPAETLSNQIVANAALPTESLEKLKNSLAVVNLGISPEVKANLNEVAKAMADALKPYSQLDFSGIQKSLEEFTKVSEALRPIQERVAELSKNLSALIGTEIISANSGGESANKSANYNGESANNDLRLTERQREILEVMKDGEEYTTETIAEKIGLKSSRTRQLINELVVLNKLESLGSTKDRRYKIK